MDSDPQELMNHLPPDHFLSLPRPEAVFGPPAGTVDTTTLAAHDFDVDNRTGFMPPQPPLTRLPASWSPWEVILDEAVSSGLQLGDKADLSDADRTRSAEWRARVRAVSLQSLIA